MNELIGGRYRARRAGGLLDSLRGAELNVDRQRRFNDAVAEVERAVKTGDELGRDLAEARLDAVIEESRAARVPSNVGQAPAEPLAPGRGFEGGVRGRRIPVAPARGMQPPPTSKELFLDAIRASEVENRGRPAQVVRIPGAQR